jgi:4a-hydroxytetrahydrobiopterin dehydratase
MTDQLADKVCIPCSGGVPPLEPEQAQLLLKQLQGWTLEHNHHLAKRYAFDDFAGALQFVNRIAAIAEEQAHHPDIYLAWGKVGVEIWTHHIDGLTESDFILAAKLDAVAP